jgi:hypothetical protein
MYMRSTGHCGLEVLLWAKHEVNEFAKKIKEENG